MLLIPCPNCGDRNASEFRYGGESHPRPSRPEETPEEEWIRYLYLRANPMGRQTEWWLHASGCGLWFLMERDRASNEVIRAWEWQASEDEDG